MRLFHFRGLVSNRLLPTALDVSRRDVVVTTFGYGVAMTPEETFFVREMVREGLSVRDALALFDLSDPSLY
jgi:hypothetical protein